MHPRFAHACLMAVIFSFGVALAPPLFGQGVPPRVANLSVAQRPGAYFVDIRYDLIDPDSDEVRVGVQASADGGATYNVPVQLLHGDAGWVRPGAGKHIVWNAWGDWPDQFTTRGRVRLIVDDTKNAVVPPPFPAPQPNLVWIPPGTFMMGSPANEVDRESDEGPRTSVYLSRGFFMGKYEVTQREYQAVKGTNPSSFTGDLDRPVEQVTWYEATDYCVRLTTQERTAGRLPAGYVYRLPTEAEWEYSCRAGTTTRFSHGDDPGYTQLGQYGWYSANSGSATHPVGGKLPNPWGLHDMHGNVWEWCYDWYGGFSGGSLTDPVGPVSGSSRVIRGGGWYIYGRYCRSAYRSDGSPDVRNGYIGFRVVLAPGLP